MTNISIRYTKNSKGKFDFVAEQNGVKVYAKTYSPRVSEMQHFMGYALVTDNARVKDRAMVYDRALISDNAVVMGRAEVYNKAMVYGTARVGGNAWIL